MILFTVSHQLSQGPAASGPGAE